MKILLISFLDKKYFGNEVSDYIWFFGIILIGYFIRNYGSKILSKQFFRLFRKFSRNDYSKEFTALLYQPFKVLVFLGTVIFAFSKLTAPADFHVPIGHGKYSLKDVVITLSEIAIAISLTWIFLRSADFFGYVFVQRERKSGESENVSVILFFKDVIKIFLVLTIFLFVLGSVFHFDVTSLITGLGISGLAIALAAQETIANLIGSFIIFLDKPFTVGELIETDTIKGVVESVGFRSTKIRTLEKTLLTVPNKKLVDSALNNITRADLRRVKFTFGLELNTSLDKIKLLKADIENLIKNHQLTNENIYVNFTDITEISLQITIIYYVNDSDLDVQFKVKEELNFGIMQLIENSGCKLASDATLLVSKKN